MGSWVGGAGHVKEYVISLLGHENVLTLTVGSWFRNCVNILKFTIQYTINWRIHIHELYFNKGVTKKKKKKPQAR